MTTGEGHLEWWRRKRMTMDATWNDEAAAKLVGKRMNLAVTYADAWLHLIRAARFCGQVVTGE